MIIFKLNKISKKNLISFTKVISYNFLFLFISCEILGRLYFKYENKLTNKETYQFENSYLIKDYLGYVNHYRDAWAPKFKDFTIFNSVNREKSLKPLNINEKSYFIYSKFSTCNTKNKCPVIIFQGDSWGRQLDTGASDILFENFINKGWVAYSYSNSSFSPSLYSAQLGYLSRKKVVPDIVMTLIDQTDIADEYFRYRSQSLPPNEKYPFYIVKPFPIHKHRNMYHYGAKFYYHDRLSIYPVTPLLIKSSFYTLLDKIDVKATQVLDRLDKKPIKKKRVHNRLNIFRNVPPNTLSTLEETNENANKYFKKVLFNYIKSSEALGVKELYLFSHPHLRHLTKDENTYSTNIKFLIEDVLKDYKSDKLKIHYLDIQPFTNNSKILITEKYFTPGDASSHPYRESIRFIANKISSFVLQKSNLIF
tara:strand:- start:325 stop:1590 length:1266 start_codon:yes stop_codon:yes gene_type:complete